MAEADYDRPRVVTSSLSGLRQISENVLSPGVHHWHGTGCQNRSGIFIRCSCLSLVSRLTCSAAVALPDTGKQDTDIIVTADISRPCNGFAMLRRVINWRFYYYYCGFVAFFVSSYFSYFVFVVVFGFMLVVSIVVSSATFLSPCIHAYIAIYMAHCVDSTRRIILEASNLFTTFLFVLQLSE